MVKQVTAWESEDGELHKSKQAAEDQDLRIALRQQGFKHETVEVIVEKRLILIKLLRASVTPDVRDIPSTADVEQQDA